MKTQTIIRDLTIALPAFLSGTLSIAFSKELATAGLTIAALALTLGFLLGYTYHRVT